MSESLSVADTRRSRILFASRPVEQLEPEGGLQLQRDLADAIAREGGLSPSVFSTDSSFWSEGINAVPVYTDDGWDFRRRLEFIAGVWRNHLRFDVLHTAHVPAPLNSKVLTVLAQRHRAAGKASVQTITGLPNGGRIRATHLWGDIVVCQATTTLDRAVDAGARATLITPWPSRYRVVHNEARRQATRADKFARWDEIVVFPGEFRRLGVDHCLGQMIDRIVKRRPATLVVLACRFDTEGIGRRLEDQNPGNVRSLGLVGGGMIELLEAADLVIFPARKMAGKFQPPLVLLESLALGTPVYATEAVELPQDHRLQIHRAPSTLPWIEHGDLIADILARGNLRAPASWGFPETFHQYVKLFDKLGG